MGVSTHVLDTSLGRPAAAVAVTLARLQGEDWTTLAQAETDSDGRCKDLLSSGAAMTAGIYRLHFDTFGYFDRLGLHSLYPYVEIVFRVADPETHFHIPLLLSANSYTTYRGS